MRCDPHPVLPPNLSADLGEGEWEVGMKRKIGKSFDEWRRIMAYLHRIQGRLASLPQAPEALLAGRELQTQTQEELDALLPSAERATAGERTLKGRGVQGRTIIMSLR